MALPASKRIRIATFVAELWRMNHRNSTTEQLGTVATRS